MEDTLVSFEVAKLLKDKEFNDSYNYAYIKGKKKPQELINNYNYTYYRNLIKQNPKHLELKEIFISPTQSLVQKWLREVHNIYVLLDETQTFAVTTGIGFYYKIIKVDTETKEHSMLSYSEYFYKTYEEALEEGIKNVLKLINND